MKSVILILSISLYGYLPGISQGTSCAAPIPINMNGIVTTYNPSGTTGGNLVCPSTGTSSVTWFSFTTNATAQCPLINLTTGDGQACEVVFYTSCGSPLTSSSMCFYDGQGLWAPSENLVLNPNQTYYLRVKTSTSCTISITAQHHTPSNIDCNGATPLGSTAITDNNACHKPALTMDPANLCAITLENTSFYRFYIATTGSAIINISDINCDNGSTNNSSGFQIGFFQGSCNSLVPINCESGSGSFIQATTAQLPAGTLVIVAIDGMNGSNCKYTLTGINALQVLSNNFFKKFSGWKTPTSNLLKWTTMNDSALYYEIERSENGNTFEVIGQVVKNGNNLEELVYSFEDKMPGKRAFYRVKMLDNKGKIALSSIIFIERNDIPAIEIKMNNPAKNLDINVQTNFEGNVNYQLVSINGQVFSTGILKCNQGINHFYKSTSFIPEGKYILMLQHKELKISKSFILIK